MELLQEERVRNFQQPGGSLRPFDQFPGEDARQST